MEPGVFMKAMILEKPGPIETAPLRLSEIAIPEPGPGEIRIKVSVCGVCHTDLHTVEGDLEMRKLPVIPGHQIVGAVDKTGPGTEIHRIGDRVGVTWFFSGCGVCTFCLEGRENLCSSAQFTGYHADGGYAQYMTVPEGSAFAIPSVFSDADAAPLLCGGVIGYRALRLSEIQPGGNLGLYGFGNSAHVVIQVALKLGCRVHVFTRGEKHRQLARELGAVWVGTPDEVPPTSLQASIIFAPAGPLVPLALQALEKGGTLVLAGITMTPIPEMDYSLIYWERTIKSVANTTRSDAEELLRIAAEIPVRTVVQEFPLERANEVLLMMKNSELKAGAILIPAYANMHSRC
jgi:propanol-preferring alcohol dehydrogenase